MLSMRMLISSLIFILGTPSLAADLLPSVYAPKAALESGNTGLYYDYEKRTNIHLTPFGEKDHFATAERSTLSAGIGLPYGWQLGLGISGISSSSQTLGNDKHFAGGIASIEKITYFVPMVALGLGVFGESVSSGAISPADRNLPADKTEIADDDEDKKSFPVVGRASTARGGAFGRFLFGNDVLKGSILGGVRYRKPEPYFFYRLRNETFFQSRLEIWPVSVMGAFFEYNQRNLQMADTRRDNISYRTRELVEVKGGALFKFDRVELALYGGAGDLNNNDDQGFGTGRKIVGASVAVILGSSERKAVPVQEGSKVAGKKTRHKVETRYRNQVKEIHRGDEIILDARTRANKPKKDIGTVMSDFEMVDQKMKKSGIKNSLKTEDELANEEILKLKNVSEKQEKLRLERQQAEDLLEEKRGQDRDQLKNEQSSEEKLSKDVESDVKALPSISGEDLKWKGLD